MNEPRIKFLFLFGMAFFLSLIFEVWAAAIVFAFILIVGYLVTGKENNEEWEDQMTHGDNGQRILCYYGDELDFSPEIMKGILDKHFPYFIALDEQRQKKFLQRLDEFIKKKTFRIHDRAGFKEMPVLVSATGIQISFGLEEYMLPQFEYIHIYPEEFIRTRPEICYLKGNVSGQSINISWKHFLEDFQYPTDGQNVGLHEMAHALYCQNLLNRKDMDPGFVSRFPGFSHIADNIFELEKKPGNDLYSEYALRNTQEFWAESIEIFFEKPASMDSVYPDLYTALRSLMNQDPLNIEQGTRNNEQGTRN